MDEKRNIPPKAMNNEAQQQASPAKPDRTRAFYETQDQTSIYEEYLFGSGTYAKGVTTQAWSDTTKGRMGIRLVTRGIFGAAAFVWGGQLANKHLLNYRPETFLKSTSKRPLQYLAYGFDMTLGKGIRGIARTIAPAKQKDAWADAAVTFRSKGYFHSNSGMDAGRSLGAEMVAMTFDFASASVGDATARNVIQAFDPSLQKPWRDEEGNLDPQRFVKSVGKATWRIFSKNQMEDWAAALPYVYQMKWQRQALSKWFPGFKLISDHAWNGGSMKVDKTGNITGDFQTPGLIDLQFRFMGYNWYTLMYRETYDAVSRQFNKWRDDGFKLDMKVPDNPYEAVAKAAISPIRYVAKSFVKAHIYMLPAVPFFWMWRTPQSKWKSGIILDNPDAQQNAIASTHPRNLESLSPSVEKIVDPKTGKVIEDVTFRTATGAGAGRLIEDADKAKAVAGGGKHTNPGLAKGGPLWFGTERVANPTGLGHGDAAYKWGNQKTIVGKLLNPFGWISYKLGSVGTGMMDRMDPNNKFFKFMGDDLLRREVFMRNFVDASLSYTPYFIAKTELGLRVDDRGPGGSLGRMDKAIYSAIDNLATFNIGGFQKSVGRMVDLVAHPAQEVAMKEGEAKAKEVAQNKPTPSAPDTRIQSATSQLGLQARRNFKTQPNDPQATGWAEGISKDRKEKAAMLYPPHNTIQ